MKFFLTILIGYCFSHAAYAEDASYDPEANIAQASPEVLAHTSMHQPEAATFESQQVTEKSDQVDAESDQVEEIASQQANQATAIKNDGRNRLNPSHPFVQALKNAYASNPELHGAIRQQFVTVESLNNAYAGWRPSITSEINHNFKKTFIDGTSILGPGTQNNRTNDFVTQTADQRTKNTATSGRITITQNLFNGWQTLNGIDQAKNNVLSGELSVIDSEQQLLLKAINAYLNLWQAKKILELRIVSERFNKSNFELLSAETEVGEKSSIDSAESEANYATAVANRLDAEAALEDAYGTYVQVIGKEPPADLLAPPNIKLNYPLPQTMTELSQRSKVSNPQSLSALYAMKAAEFAIGVAEGKLMPSLSASAAGTRTLSRDGHGLNISSRSRIRQNEGVIGLQLQVPIYQQGQEWSGIRQTTQQYYIARNKYHVKQREIIQQVQSVWKTWKAAEQGIEKYKTAVKAYELNREGKLEEYKVGTITLTDTLQAESQLVQTQVNLLQAEVKFLINGYKLMALYGDLLPESLNLGITRYNVNGYQDDVQSRLFGTGDLYKNLELEKLPTSAPIDPLDVREGVTQEYSKVALDNSVDTLSNQTSKNAD